MTILILGISGMLGHVMFRVLAASPNLKVFGTVRNQTMDHCFPDTIRGNIIGGIDIENSDALIGVLTNVRPHVVINCIGLVKQVASANDPLQVVPINTILPHRLARLCQAVGARFIHFSTDCVFSGARSDYTEVDFPDAHDLYGRTKLLGEVVHPHAVTIRTSIIGHQINNNYGLLGWFLSQNGTVNGFTRAVFSGLPTVEIAHVVRDIILPRPNLHGLYHVASQPISKYSLLCLIANLYEKNIEIVPDDSLVINRSLNSDHFFSETGYKAPAWRDMIISMRNYR